MLISRVFSHPRAPFGRLRSPAACTLAAFALPRASFKTPCPLQKRPSHTTSSPSLPSLQETIPDASPTPSSEVPQTSNQSQADLVSRVLADAEVLMQNEATVMDLFQQLKTALEQGDFTAVSDLWSQLRKFGPGNPSPLRSRRFFELYSDAIHSIHTSLHPIPAAVLPYIDDILIHSVVIGANSGAEAQIRFYLMQDDPRSALNFVVQTDAALRSRSEKLAAISHRGLNAEYLQMTGQAAGVLVRTLHVRLKAYAIVAAFKLDDFGPLLCLLPLQTQPHSLQATVTIVAEETGLPTNGLVDWTMRLCDLNILGLPINTFKYYISSATTGTYRASTTQLKYIAAGLTKELSRRSPHITLEPAAATTASHPLIIFSEEHWAILMRSLIITRHLEEAERFWLDMHKLAGRTPPLVQAAIIEGFASSKNFARARAVWKAFTSTGKPPAAAVYRVYLKTLLLEGSAANAMAEFKAFEQELRKSPADDSRDDAGSTSVFNVVLEWLVGQSRIDDALNVLKRMKKKGPQPDVTSFNALLKHYRKTRDVQAISGVIQEMEALGMHGDVYTISILLPAILSVRTDAVHLVLALLRQSGTVIHLDTYYTLLNHLVRADEDAGFEAAIAVLDYMEADEPEFAPTGRALGVVLEGVERRVWSNPELAQHYRRVIMSKMYRRSGKSGYISERFTMKVILACCQNPTSDGIHRAMGYYRKHVRPFGYTDIQRVGGDVWFALLAQLIRRSEWVFADELVRDLQDSGVALSESPIRSRLLSLAQRRDSNVEYLEDITED